MRGTVRPPVLTIACTSESVVILSNGYAMDMDATVRDSASDVQSVN
jgi:hypothetical protein